MPASKGAGRSLGLQEVGCRVGLRAGGSWITTVSEALGGKPVLLGNESLLRDVSGAMGAVNQLPAFTVHEDLCLIPPGEMELILLENMPRRPLQRLLLGQAGPARGSVVTGTGVNVHNNRPASQRPVLGLPSLLPGQSSCLHAAAWGRGADALPSLGSSLQCGDSEGHSGAVTVPGWAL